MYLYSSFSFMNLSYRSPAPEPSPQNPSFFSAQIKMSKSKLQAIMSQASKCKFEAKHALRPIAGGPTLISTKPSLSSKPWNGPPPPLSLSVFPAHTLQLIGLSSSAPRTSPTQIKTTERTVSIEMSSGRAAEGV